MSKPAFVEIGRLDEGGCPEFVLLGNRLCLDFANTVHAKRRNLDMLRTPGDIPAFLLAAGEIAREEKERMEALLLAAPDKAANLLSQALQFRKLFRDWLTKLDEREYADPPLVDGLRFLLSTMPHVDSLEARPEGGWRQQVEPLGDQVLWILRPILLSVGALVAEKDGLPVRKCGNPRCPIFFYDVSRTGKRRWCSMDSCGNQAKVRAFLNRQQT